MDGATMAFWLMCDPPLLACSATWVEGRRPGDGFWSLRTTGPCPLCGKKAGHTHGGGHDAMPQGGHRVAHCATGRGGYVLVVVKQLPSKAECQRRARKQAAQQRKSA